MRNVTVFSILFAILICGINGRHLSKCYIECNERYNPRCAFNGLQFKQFDNECQIDVINCEQKLINRPEYNLIGKQFCDTSISIPIVNWEDMNDDALNMIE